MTAFLLPLVAATAAVLFTVGLVRVRRDPLSALAIDDLSIINARGQRSIRGSSDPKSKLGGPLGRIVRRGIGVRGVGLVDDLIDRAGRPEGRTVTSFFNEVGYYSLITGFVAVTALVMGMGWLLPVTLVLVGAGAPFYVLWATAQERQEILDRDLPDFLDVLAVVVSAGLGFQQALDRVARRFGGPLGEEMQMALNGMAVGESFRESLGGVRDRTRSESVDQFVTALLQAEELGSPLTVSLNQIAVDVRREASEGEKRRAAKAAPKATVVTILLFMPPTLAIMVYGMIVALNG
ncbi:MAG: type II secretion system F family protein [Actinomycetota bacterium]|nr:type II secretion system F family protein [Actinomycetota bacterium]